MESPDENFGGIKESVKRSDNDNKDKWKECEKIRRGPLIKIGIEEMR
jgi:hypothetical protein